MQVQIVVFSCVDLELTVFHIWSHFERLRYFHQYSLLFEGSLYLILALCTPLQITLVLFFVNVHSQMAGVESIRVFYCSLV